MPSRGGKSCYPDPNHRAPSCRDPCRNRPCPSPRGTRQRRIPSRRRAAALARITGEGRRMRRSWPALPPPAPTRRASTRRASTRRAPPHDRHPPYRPVPRSRDGRPRPPAGVLAGAATAQPALRQSDPGVPGAGRSSGPAPASAPSDPAPGADGGLWRAVQPLRARDAHDADRAHAVLRAEPGDRDADRQSSGQGDPGPGHGAPWCRQRRIRLSPGLRGDPEILPLQGTDPAA